MSDPTAFPVVHCASCGNTITRLGAPLFFLGQRWFFCSFDCRVTFKRDPQAHAAKGQGLPPEMPPNPAPSKPKSSLFTVRAAPKDS